MTKGTMIRELLRNGGEVHYLSKRGRWRPYLGSDYWANVLTTNEIEELLSKNERELRIYFKTLPEDQIMSVWYDVRTDKFEYNPEDLSPEQFEQIRANILANVNPITDTQQAMIDKLQQIGGVMWERDNIRRVYFNDLARWYGLSYSTYKSSGRPYNCSLDGKPISNNQAYKLITKLQLNAKFWYDVNTGEFASRNLSTSEFEKIRASILEAMKGVEVI